MRFLIIILPKISFLLLLVVGSFFQTGCFETTHQLIPEDPELTEMNAFLAKAAAMNSKRQFDSSIVAAEKALKIIRKKQNLIDKELDCLTLLMGNHLNLGHNKLAIGIGDSALAIQKRSGRDSVSVTSQKIINNLSIAYKRIGEYGKALKYGDLAFNYRVKLYGLESTEVAASLNNIGLIYYDQRLFQDAIGYFRKSINIKTKIMQPDNPEFIPSYINLANCYYYKSSLDTSKAYATNALQLIQKTIGEESPEGGRINNLMGIVYSEEYDYPRALKFYLKGLEIRKKLLGSSHFETIQSMSNIGTLFADFGEYEKAISVFSDVIKETIEFRGNEYPDLIGFYKNIAASYYELRNLEKAAFYTTESTKLCTKLFGKYHSYIFSDLTNYGNIHDVKKEYLQALNYYQLALAQLDSIGDNSDRLYEAETYNSIANTYRKMGKQDSAFVFLNKSLSIIYQNEEFKKPESWPVYPENPRRYFALKTLSLKNETYLSLYFKTKRKKFLLESLILNEKLMDFIDDSQMIYSDDNSKHNFTEYSEDAASLYIYAQYELYKRDKNPERAKKALAFSERSRQRLVNEHYFLLKEKVKGDHNSLLFDQDSVLSSELLKIESGMEVYSVNSKEPEFLEMQSNFASTVLKRGEIRKKLLEKYNPKFQTQNLITQQLSESGKLPGNPAFIEYHQNDTILFIFLIQKGKVDFFRSSIPANFKTIVQEYQESIKYSDQDLFLKTAAQLYNLLFKPIQSHLKSKSLIIIPHNQIALIPFESLIIPSKTRKTYFLVEDYHIQYMNTFLNQGKIENSSITPKKYKWFGVAPVRFRYSGSDSLISLPASLNEMNKIKMLFDQKKFPAFTLTQNYATKTGLLQSDFQNSSILHFSTHYTINTTNPSLSYLNLSSENSSDDYKLTPGEIEKIKFKGDLVVLNGCETANGKQYPGDGLYNLTRSFFLGGSQRILVSVYPVQDNLATEFMVDFYQELLENNQTYGMALRQVKLKRIEANKPVSEWASYLLYSKERPIDF
ncbi:MAG: CHAT domain-containing protein [Bacteroidetes bacterium]|nr:CHAT domain-containing protein [Bacteroidota bacterium]